MFFVRAKNLPSDLTSYDCLKSLAVILMVVDHVGMYIMPDQTWWKTASSSVPIWFFFVGYANSKNLTPPIWIGAAMLVVSSMVLGFGLLPLSILVTIILSRFLIDRIMAFSLESRRNLLIVCGSCVLFWLPSRELFEYGTLAFLIAMYGWLIRHQDESEDIKALVSPFMSFVMIAFIAGHFLGLNFTEHAQKIVFAVSTISIFIITSMFKNATFPNAREKLTGAGVATLQIMGRYSLYLYVGHVVLFQIIAVIIGHNTLFDWRWM